jgi:S-adenosylmethionine decarboxylase proenzyme
MQNPETVEYVATGRHLLLTLSGCSALIMNDPQALIELVRRAALATGSTVMQISMQQFEPQGVTAFAVLAESHASLHTYPESQTVFWDCFTCGNTCDPEKSIAVLVEALRPESVNHQTIARG